MPERAGEPADPRLGEPLPGIQVQAMRDRRLPKAAWAFLRQLTAALPPRVER